MTRIATILVPLVAAIGLTACLEAGRSSGSSDTVTSDTTSSTDTVVTDSSQTDTVPSCTDASCDDGDPCTVDVCDPDTLTCQHYQPPAAAVQRPWECDGDANCDDGDACSIDSCVHVDDGCGNGYAYCAYEPIDGCYGCFETGCDDGDPCTVDICQDDGTCINVPGESCAFACNGQNVTSHMDAIYGVVGAAAKLAGTIRPDTYTVCLDGACECTGLPGIQEGDGQNIGLYPNATAAGDDPAWLCTSDSCSGETPVCAPLQYDVAYWVWGTAEQRSSVRYARGSGAAVPAEPRDLLLVWDYCLQTNAAGLVGHYTGTFTSNAYGETTFDLEADIFVDGGGQLMLNLRAPDCPACGDTPISYFFPQTVPVHAGDGWISFEVDSPTICNAIMPPAEAKLFSHQSTLSGSYHDMLVGGDGNGDVPYCAYGDISLSRLP